MQNPIISIFDAFLNKLIEREMTEEEYAELLANGWTETPADPEPEAEVAPDTP